jgi:acetoin utilization deacetylase AcuC-like enzyme
MKASKINGTNDNVAMMSKLMASMTSEQLKTVLGEKFKAIEPQSEARFVLSVHETKYGNQCIKASLIDSSKKKPYDIYLTADMAMHLVESIKAIETMAKKLKK